MPKTRSHKRKTSATASGSSGIVGKKPKQSSTRTTNDNAPIFIVCPGAGGVLPQEGTLEKQLALLGKVVVIPKSTGYSGMRGCLKPSKEPLNKNLQILNDAIAKEVSHSESEQPIILVGQSFGCRLIVSVQHVGRSFY